MAPHGHNSLGWHGSPRPPRHGMVHQGYHSMAWSTRATKAWGGTVHQAHHCMAHPSLNSMGRHGPPGPPQHRVAWSTKATTAWHGPPRLPQCCVVHQGCLSMRWRGLARYGITWHQQHGMVSPGMATLTHLLPTALGQGLGKGGTPVGLRDMASARRAFISILVPPHNKPLGWKFMPRIKATKP